MARSVQSITELLISEYETQTRGGKKLSDADKKIITDCAAGTIGPVEAAQKLPPLSPWPASYREGNIDDWIDDNHAKKELPQVIRFLQLAHEAGGSEYVSGEVHEFLQWEHRGTGRKDLFGEGKLSPLIELSFLFYELYDDIHEYEMSKLREEIEAYYKKDPALFTEIANRKGHPAAGLRAAAFLHRQGNAAMEQRITELAAELKKASPKDAPDSVDGEFSFTLCAENGFAHPVLRETLKENFKNVPAHMTGRIAWNLYHNDRFLDRSLIEKKRGEKEEFAQMNYVLAMCRDLGIPDRTAYQSIIGEFSDYHRRELAALLKPLSGEEFESAVSWMYEHDDVTALRAMAAVCESRPEKDFAVLVKILDKRWDSIVQGNIINRAGSNKQHLSDFFFKHDDAALGRIEGDLNNPDDEGELFGLFAGEETLKERIRRYAILVTHPKLLPSACKFSRSLYRKYAGKSFLPDAPAFAAYFLDSDLAVEHKLVFIDEMTIPDSVRHPKDEAVLLDEVSEFLRRGAQPFLMAHREETHEFIRNGIDFWDFGLLSCYYYGHSQEADPLPLLSIMGAKQKLVKKRILEALAGYPQMRGEVEKLLSSKVKQVRTNAEAALAQWNELAVMDQSAGNTGAAKTDFKLDEYVAKNMPSAAKKLLSFTGSASWPSVRFANPENGQVPLDILCCYTALYLESKEMKRLFGAEQIRSFLDEKDMKVFICKLYEDWLAGGAEAKTKGMMVLYSIHGGDEAVRALKAKVKEFDYASRSAMAGDAVRAIAVSSSPAALVTVDTLGRTYQNKLVRRMAAEALADAAKLLGITVEELADRIVPNLGLNEKGDLFLSTNIRSWKAMLGPDMKITLYNSDGKKISALPAMNKEEDPVQYEAAKAELSLLKKELRTVISGQIQRLELILSSERSWTKEAFEDLFVKNPVMAVFAVSLVFGLYKDGALKDTFRYNGDGTYSGPDDDAFALKDGAEIRLVHPLHMDDELKNKWRAILANYELGQPFPQLDRKIYRPEKAEENKTEYERFKGSYVNGGAFVRRMFKSNWRRGPILDGGSYDCIEKKSGGYETAVHFGEIDDFCVGNEFDTPIELDSLTFTRLSDKTELCLKDTPPELYSETVYTVEAAIAAAQIKQEE